MADKASIKQKQIRIQKPAQSLTAFQRSVASGTDERSDLIRYFAIAVGAMLAITVVVVSWNLLSSRRIEQHEAALAVLISEVDGNRTSPVPPAEREQRMRGVLSRLEELASKAPGSCKPVALGMLSAWKLELDGQGAGLPAPSDPWSRLGLAQRSIALGQAAEAHGLISTLHGKADPNQAWSPLYWAALLQARQLEGNREQALKDYAEYRKRFKSQADLATMDKLLGII
jgi:hypothetical protein